MLECMYRSAAAALAVLAAAVVSCSAAPAGSPAPATTHSPARHSPPPVLATVSPAGVTGHSVPGCSTAVQPAAALPKTAVTMTGVPLDPFDVVTAPSGRWAFVSLNGADAIGVMRIGTGGLPSMVRQIRLPVAPGGEALTPDGRYLLAADGSGGAEVISVPAAESGASGAVLGDITTGSDGGAVTVTVSPDGRFAFVAMEDAAQLAVFSLPRALAGRFGKSGYLGSIPAGPLPTTSAFSPDGQWLYATSEGPTLNVAGSLVVINARTAETDPARSVIATVPSGCNPVRVMVSPGRGSVVWVTARASDALLAFSAARLRTDPRHALLAAVPVGAAPVDLAFGRAGALIVVTDSDRFYAAGESASLAVVGSAAALAGRPALLGYLPAGSFPRQVAAEPGGLVLLVTNFDSDQLEAVNTAGLP
jgi:DNA-binding beta-propeller fold protein YncE